MVSEEGEPKEYMVVNAAVERNEAALKKVSAARGEVAKDRCMQVYKEEKRKL